MKKFFKILMVLALLSGAALSCTKDYSKEIADVQKQNQDLQALVASLQNALNSTNATVSQLNSTSDKQAADIAALASANAEAFATIVADHAGDVAYLEGLIEDLKTAGATDLAAAVKELKEAIEAGNGAAAAALAAKAEELAKAIKDGDDAVAAKLAEEVAALEAKIKAGGDAAADLKAAIDELKKAIKEGDDKAAADLTAKAEELAKAIADGDAASAAALDAAKKELEGKIAACADAAAVKELVSAVTTCKEDIAKLKEALDGKIADLDEILKKALGEKAEELEKAIKEVEGKADVNATAIAKIEKDLEGIAATLDEYKGLIKTNAEDIAKNAEDIVALGKLIDKNAEDIVAAQKEIDAIKEQIKSLSARLTNIVAAPAKDVEIQSFKWAGIEKTTVNMNFIVAPTAAAEAVAEGFKNHEVDVILYINSGRTRKSDAKPDSCDYVIIPNKVIAKDGVITVSAIVDTAFANLTPEVKGNAAEPISWSYYATLAVSGEDEVGPWQRVSDPVKPIVGSIGEVEYAWYKDDKAVEDAPADFTLKSKDFGAKDSVAVVGNVLTIVKADWDWKSEEYKVENIIAGYEPKFVIGTTAYSVAEFKEAFELHDTLDIAPRFVGFAQAFTKPFEWGSELEGSSESADSTLFKATVKADSTINAYGFAIVLPEKEADQVEAVGKATKFAASKIAFGKVADCPLGVKFYQRIGKHVQAEKAVEKTLDVKFGITEINGKLQAAEIDTTFEQVTWKSTTQIGDCKLAAIINADKDTVGAAAIKVHGVDPKLVDVEVYVPYTDKKQELKAILIQDAKKNAAGTITVVEYGDYFDLTVEKRHDDVKATPSIGDVYAAKKGSAITFKTDKTVKDILGDYEKWLIKEGSLDNADSLIVHDWLKNNAFNHTKVEAKQGTKSTAITPDFTTHDDTLSIKFADFAKFDADKEVKVTLVDTIDNIVFDYSFAFTPKKPGVKVVAIPGFVVDNVITVEGKLNEAEDDYVIDDINLANYFKVTGLEEKNDIDAVIKVTFTNAPKGIHYSAIDTLYAVDSTGVLPEDAKVQWDTLKAISFELIAQALLEDSPVGDPVKVKVQTADPILTIADVKIDSTLHGQEATFKLLDSLKIYSILDNNENIYSDGLTPYCGEDDGVKLNKEDKSDWTCTVNGQPYEGAELFTFDDEKNELTYKKHDAVGQVVITIPYKFTYKFGEKTFNVILTIN